MNKEDLRKSMKKKLNKQTVSERRTKSRLIQNKLFRQDRFLSSKYVMLYVSKGTGEVDTSPIIKKALNMGKKVVLPVTVVRERKIRPVRLRNPKQDFIRSQYGIYEPRESGRTRPIRIKDIDLVIVPGLAFDRHNNRLGRGQGYYDRFLKRLSGAVPKIGLGFRFQLLKNIPTTANDVPLTRVICN
ncbi:MAG: 5-formyltetrahydrofolate cyclo-ligase [Candidatus Omnitrophica bacterium]|nr:5-formyltetrahydrofolate cyclo-ligase [Candidatus Omnitrophota bacterium]MBU1933521.1 5-formyltetrahydrofolate cyclo-ligase [Candidatus Omnitrophota bacterium]